MPIRSEADGKVIAVDGAPGIRVIVSGTSTSMRAEESARDAAAARRGRVAEMQDDADI
jgi:hypothetical protein